MSLLQATPLMSKPAVKRQKDIAHRIRVAIAAACAFLLVAAIGIYGASYYILPLQERPYSDKYDLLKPGGTIGLKLGISVNTVLTYRKRAYGRLHISCQNELMRLILS